MSYIELQERLSLLRVRNQRVEEQRREKIVHSRVQAEQTLKDKVRVLRWLQRARCVFSWRKNSCLCVAHTAANMITGAGDVCCSDCMCSARSLCITGAGDVMPVVACNVCD